MAHAGSVTQRLGDANRLLSGHETVREGAALREGSRQEAPG
jgi:hypothetical protein